MNLLTVEKLCKSFGEKILFWNISFGIEEGDKIGVIGINGTGKTTLLKIIAGAEHPDRGTITTKNGIQIGYLPQEPVFGAKTTVLQYVFQCENATMGLVGEYEEALQALAKKPLDSALSQRVALLSEKMDKLDAWGIESDAKTILTKLGITEFHKQVRQLSGGQKKRVALAAALIRPVDLLILDEPTNHIDSKTIEWLEDYLQKYKKGLFMITHDRYFLDRVAKRTLELHDGTVTVYQANYSQFLEMKMQREELMAAKERKRQNFLRRELEWVQKGAQARSTKQKARLQRFEDVSNQKALCENTSVEISVGASRLGRKTIEINHIVKAYDNQIYINDFSYIILKNDRIGIVGPNGCGKSTLIQILTGRLMPDRGNVEIGDTVKIGVFSQENEDLNHEMRVIDVIKEIAEYVPTPDGRISASQMLEKFLFSKDAQWSPVSKLSGGEKRRLYLLKILMSAPNILFLDEPTNDLDIETLSILEDYLDNFPGAVVTVSHDRYFLDRTVNRIFAFEKYGVLKQYEGGYTDYSAKTQTQETVLKEPKTQKPVLKNINRPKKMSYMEQKEYDVIGDEIARLENKIENIEKEIMLSESDYMKLQELIEQKESIKQNLEQKMERWVYLSELAEEIAKSSK